MMAVVAFIGIVVAAAAPSWVELQRDRRADAAARAIADMYRIARSRALGRGSAVMVRWDANAAMPVAGAAAPTGHFTIREAIAPITGQANSANLPSASCFRPTWVDGEANSKHVAVFDERVVRYAPAVATFIDDNGAPQQVAQICFTPRGRTWVRYANAGAFTVLTGVPRVQVQNATTKLNRFVPIPSHGSARVVSEL
jgi:type II secretory pathway pseudopilin PulG